MNLTNLMPLSWKHVLREEFEKPYFKELEHFLEKEFEEYTIFPPKESIFSAFQYSSFEETKVLILGQDPYHGEGQAHGLCFSVQPNIKIPPSLRNMYKELQADIGCDIPKHGYLVSWAKQGILMINAVLTVRAHAATSHKKKGWETFTDAVIKKLNERENPLVFVLWGGFAKKKQKLIDTSKHKIILGAHPSPLSARNGFFGSRPYSAINRALEEFGYTPINWQLPENPEEME